VPGGFVVLNISYDGAMSTAWLVDNRGAPHDFGLAVRVLWSPFAADRPRAAPFVYLFRRMHETFQAIQAVTVMEDQQTDRDLLLLDELIQSEDVAVECSFPILSSIGQLLDAYPGASTVWAYAAWSAPRGWHSKLITPVSRRRQRRLSPAPSYRNAPSYGNAPRLTAMLHLTAMLLVGKTCVLRYMLTSELRKTTEGRHGTSSLDTGLPDEEH
jgi:hypothetical protein